MQPSSPTTKELYGLGLGVYNSLLDPSIKYSFHNSFDYFFKWANPDIFYRLLSVVFKLQILQQINVKMSIQYTVRGFEPTTFKT